MIHLRYLLIILSAITISTVGIATAQQGQTLTPIESGLYVSLVSGNGSVEMHKIFGTATIYQPNSLQNTVIDSYDIQIYQLNTNNGKWQAMAINNQPCITEFYHINDYMILECYRQMPSGFLIIQYSVSSVGVKVTAQYQHENRNENQTHYFKFVETMSADFDGYDETLELITAKGKVLKPTNEFRLLQKGSVSYDGSQLITEFGTPEKLKRGYMIEISRDFDY